jgi:two-component system, NtrC family, sensor kinase
MKTCIHKILLLVVLILSSFIAYNQNNTIDSLNKVLQIQKEDTNKVNTLNELASIMIQRSDYSKSLEFANKALTLSETLNYKKGKGLAYKNIGGSHQNFEEALKYLNNALIIFEETKEKQDIADCYLKIGSTYFYLQQNYPEALKNILIALKLFEQTGQKKGTANCFKLLGILYSNQGEKAEALTQSLNALKVYKEIKDSIGTAYVYNVIGNTYSVDGKLSEALKNFFDALKTYQQLGERGPDFGISWTQRNIGSIYLKQAAIADAAGNKAEADNKFKEVLETFNTIYKSEEERKISHVDTYLMLGQCYMDLGRRTTGLQGNKYILKSKMFYEKLLGIAKDSGNKILLLNCYHSLTSINVILGNYSEAYRNQSMTILYKDSLNNEQNTRKTVQLKMQYEFDKKEAISKAEQEKKDAEAKRVKNFQYFAIAGLGIVVLAIVAIALIQFRNNKQKQKVNLLLESQKQKVENTLVELKSTQAQLIQSEKMASLGELTAGIAHEIQNPLNFVNNFSEVNTELVDEMQQEMDKGNYEDAKAISNDIKENEQKINLHGKRADAIVKGMLQHSQTSTGQKEPTDINKLADEYLRLSYQGLRAKNKTFNATLKTDFDETIGKINIIPQDIGRVILNLINNAFYAASLSAVGGFSDPDKSYNPTVWVSTKKVADKVLISVRDNGPGIPQKIVDKIFQPFFTTKPTGQGTGLGLSLSYDIIKAHGGEIKVETKEGEGAEFIIQLPVS